MFLLELIAFGTDSSNLSCKKGKAWKLLETIINSRQGPSRNKISNFSEINFWKHFSGSAIILVPTVCEIAVKSRDLKLQGVNEIATRIASKSVENEGRNLSWNRSESNRRNFKPLATSQRAHFKGAQSMTCTLWTETLEFWRLKVPNFRCFPLEPFFEINPGILCSGIGS